MQIVRGKIELTRGWLKKVMDIEPARQLQLNFKNLNSRPSYNSTIVLNLRVSHPLVFIESCFSSTKRLLATFSAECIWSIVF